MKTLGH